MPEREVDQSSLTESPTFLGELEKERVELPAPALVVLDGPAGSGKSVLGQKLGLRYGLPVFEGGTFNRVATVIALERGIDLDDGEACGQIARDLEFDLERMPDGSQRVIYRGQDITEATRTPEVSELCPKLSLHKQSQDLLYGKFAAKGRNGYAIMVGRVSGRWLMPEAPVKAFITGKVSIRAARRGVDVESLHRRDMTDGRRPHIPMRRAPDAKVFRNNDIPFRQLFCEVAAYFEEAYDLEPTRSLLRA